MRDAFNAAADAWVTESLISCKPAKDPPISMPSRVVRVSEKGYLGRRGGVDMLVAMNPETWKQDVEELSPGGYLFYDATRPMPHLPVLGPHPGEPGYLGERGRILPRDRLRRDPRQCRRDAPPTAR